MSSNRFGTALVAGGILFILLSLSGSAWADGWEGGVLIAEGYEPKVAVEENFIHVIYRDAPFGYPLLYERSTDGGDTWQAPFTVANGLDIVEPQIEVYEGTVHIVWRRENTGEIRYRRNTQNGANAGWESAHVLSTTATKGKEPDIAVNNTSIIIPTYDRVSVVWIGTLGLNTVYCATSDDLGATWAAPAVATSVTSGFIEEARVAVTRVSGAVLAWRHETSSASTIYCKYAMSPFAAVVLWTGPQGTFGDISMPYDSQRVYVTREDPDGPVQRVGVTSMGSLQPTFGPDIDLGGGGRTPEGDASSSYIGSGCTAYGRQYPSNFWGIYVSTGPGSEMTVGPICPSQPRPDIAADGCGNMHLVSCPGPGVDDIRYYRYMRPVLYQFSAELLEATRSDAAWGDYDGDGDLDVILCGETTSGPRTRLYENQGGSLVYHAPDFTGITNDRSSGCLAWGDYDGDGDVDLAMAGQAGGGQVARIYRNDGGGTMSWDTAQVLTGVGNASLAWGDVDGDGDLDLVVMGLDGATRVATLYENDPPGTLTPDAATTLTGVSSGSLDWADWDGDGDLDLLQTGSDGASARTIFYENDPVGTLTDSGSHGAYGVWASDAAWGDFDNDGDLDLALTGERASGGPRCAVVYENDGTGALSQVVDVMSIYNSSCAWGDYDGDGDLDVIFGGYDGSSLHTRVYRNTGSGFSQALVLTGMDNGSLSFADFDGDRDIDLLATGGNQGAMIANLYENTGCPVNTAPTVPTVLDGTQTGYGLDLGWSGATDGQTGSDGLYYCLRVGTAPGADDVVSGTYGTPLLGNVGQATTLHLNLPPATHYWSVRTIDPGFMKSTWSPEQTCEPGALDWANHDVGNSVLTVTDQGILGFMDCTQAAGSGFVFPAAGENLLYIGGLWVGESADYVANRDYDDDPESEWVVSTDPDGHLVMQSGGYADQTLYAGYTDDGATVPRGLYVRQESHAWASAPDDDFVIIRYHIANHGQTTLSDLYVGQFLDVDVETFTTNTGSTDLWRRMAYITGGTQDLHVGAVALCGGPDPDPVANVTLIDNSVYVHPYSYVMDVDKYGFLAAADPAHVLADAPVPEDYSLLVSIGPISIAPGDSNEVAVAIVGGVGLTDLLQNADAARSRYCLGCGVDDPQTLPLRVTRLLPNTPNPFNPTTTIHFQLAQEERVKVVVYDVGGRLVRSILDSRRHAGHHALTWDGRDDSGRVAGSGVYFLSLEAGRHADSRRVVLLK